VPVKGEVKNESFDDIVYIVPEENVLADIVTPIEDVGSFFFQY
jgi:hypothetical protein